MQRRDAAGRRVFTGEEVEWLKVCTKLRSSGMPLPEIRRYAELVVAGPGNEIERFERFVTDWEFREYAYHL